MSYLFTAPKLKIGHRQARLHPKHLVTRPAWLGGWRKDDLFGFLHGFLLADRRGIFFVKARFPLREAIAKGHVGLAVPDALERLFENVAKA